MTNSLASSTGVAAPSSILILDPRERAMKYGIEVHGPTPTDGITFLAGTWSPGGEYTQKLVNTISCFFFFCLFQYFYTMTFVSGICILYIRYDTIGNQER